MQDDIISLDAAHCTYSNMCIELPQKNFDSRFEMLKRVLIADDNVYVRYVVRTFLHDQAEIEICGEAVDGVDAIEKTRRLNPDLVLLDLSMPSLNGAEVALVLKNTKPDVRIIMFTMYSSKISPSLRSALGVDAVLSKPDGMGHLVESINAVFNA
jgi:two-component system nitrate/nitrite response regulator NarL